VRAWRRSLRCEIAWLRQYRVTVNVVRDLVAGSGLAFTDRGMHELKGVPGEWQVLALDVQ
jgi:hypothetical protein